MNLVYGLWNLKLAIITSRFGGESIWFIINFNWQPTGYPLHKSYCLYNKYGISIRFVSMWWDSYPYQQHQNVIAIVITIVVKEMVDKTSRVNLTDYIKVMRWSDWFVTILLTRLRGLSVGVANKQKWVSS